MKTSQRFVLHKLETTGLNIPAGLKALMSKHEVESRSSIQSPGGEGERQTLKPVTEVKASTTLEPD